jgi:hypothetical protein
MPLVLPPHIRETSHKREDANNFVDRVQSKIFLHKKMVCAAAIAMSGQHVCLYRQDFPCLPSASTFNVIAGGELNFLFSLNFLFMQKRYS